MAHILLNRRFMKSFLSPVLSFAAVAVTLFSLSGTARADALPQDSCASVSDVGQSCNNAGASFDEPGTCVASTCVSGTHLPDGGSTTGTYACTLCEVPDGGAASDAGSDGGAITIRDDAGPGATPSSSSSSCSASPGTRDGATAFGMLAIGVLGLALGRRNKRA